MSSPPKAPFLHQQQATWIGQRRLFFACSMSMARYRGPADGKPSEYIYGHLHMSIAREEKVQLSENKIMVQTGNCK